MNDPSTRPAKMQQVLGLLAQLSKEVQDLRRQVLIAERAQLERPTRGSHLGICAGYLSIVSSLENQPDANPKSRYKAEAIRSPQTLVIKRSEQS